MLFVISLPLRQDPALLLAWPVMFRRCLQTGGQWGTRYQLVAGNLLCGESAVSTDASHIWRVLKVAQSGMAGHCIWHSDPTDLNPTSLHCNVGTCLACN
jgi:hypothetical protein